MASQNSRRQMINEKKDKHSLLDTPSTVMVDKENY